MNGFLRQSQLFIKRNGHTILTCIRGAGVIVTSIMAVKAAPKALDIIEEAREEKGEELSKWEIVKEAGPSYIPTVLIGANVMNKKQQAALVSAYALIDSSYKEYKQKLKELYGEEAHSEIVEAIAIEKAEDISIRSECLLNSCDLSSESSTGEPVLFYDEYGNRYFESTIEQVMNAEYHLNRNFVLIGYAVLNELYEFLGLETTDYGSAVGWAAEDELY